MSEFLALLGTYGFNTVLIITIVMVVCIYKVIVWSKKTWAQRAAFQAESVAKGQSMQKEIDKQEEHDKEEESRLEALEAALQTLTEESLKQQARVNLLIQSDQLNIKAWIKEQHEKWMAIQAIDGQSLDLLESRFAIYEEEGGNSWAHRLMEDIRALPLITVIPVAPHKQD